MPRTTRSSKSTAPSPAPLSHVENVQAQETLDKAVEVTGIDVEQEQDQDQDGEEDEGEKLGMGKGKGNGSGKGKGKGKASDDDNDDEETNEGAGKKVSPEERLEKLKALRTRMVSPLSFRFSFHFTLYRGGLDLTVRRTPNPNTQQNQSTAANRSALITDSQARQTTHRELARLTKQKILADNLREKIDAEENGLDVGRKNNWKWSIEQNQTWAKGEEEKMRRGEIEFDGEHSGGLFFAH